MRQVLSIFIVVMIIFGFNTVAFGNYRDDRQVIISQLIPALIQVESGGNNWQIGDKNRIWKAYGCLQIREAVCIDVNRRWHTHYRASDCYGNRSLSILICLRYFRLYDTARVVGHQPTLEDLARMWNGGPYGFKKRCTLSYWRKVEKVLHSER